MKYFSLSLSLLFVFIIMSCSSRQGPSWLYDQTAKNGMLRSSGSALPNIANDYNIQRLQANARASDAMARQIELRVKQLVKDFVDTTGHAKKSTIALQFSSVTKQVVQLSLKGATQKDLWVDEKTNQMHVLLVLDTKSVDKFLSESSTKKIFKSEYSDWQRFLSKQAHDELKSHTSH